MTQVFVLVIAWYKKIKVAISIVREASKAVQKVCARVADYAEARVSRAPADAWHAADPRRVYARGVLGGCVLVDEHRVHPGAWRAVG